MCTCCNKATLFTVIQFNRLFNFKVKEVLKLVEYDDGVITTPQWVPIGTFTVVTMFYSCHHVQRYEKQKEEMHASLINSRGDLKMRWNQIGCQHYF